MSTIGNSTAALAKSGNRSTNFVRHLVKTPVNRLSGLSRSDKIQLANKLTNDNIDVMMLLYVYFVFLAVVIVIVMLYRFKQEDPHKFKGDIRAVNQSFWSRFVNWLFVTPASSERPVCSQAGKPSAEASVPSQPSCSEINQMYSTGKSSNGTC